MYTYTSEVKWLTTVFVEKSDKVLFHFSFYQQTYMTLTDILFLALSLSLSLIIVLLFRMKEVYYYTVKPVLVVTSIKQPTCIKQPEESCPKIHIPIYLNCIKQPPAFSSHILSFPWVAA